MTLGLSLMKRRVSRRHYCRLAADARPPTAGAVRHAVDRVEPHRPVWTAGASEDPTWIRLQATVDCRSQLVSIRQFLIQERQALGEQAYKREYLGIPGGGRGQSLPGNCLTAPPLLRALGARRSGFRAARAVAAHACGQSFPCIAYRWQACHELQSQRYQPLRPGHLALSSSR